VLRPGRLQARWRGLRPARRAGALVGLAGVVVSTLAAVAWSAGRSPEPAGAVPGVVHRVTLTPPRAENLTGSTHTVTVFVEQSTDGGVSYTPAAGAKPTIAVNPSSTTIVANTCAAPGTEANGRCTVIIGSTATGTTTVTASYRGSVATGEGELATASATKTWVTFRLTISPPSAVNPTGTSHTFRVQVDADQGSGPAPFAGASVGLAVTGPGELSAITGGSGSTLAPDRRSGSCSTDPAGTCLVVITSQDAGTTTLSAVYAASVGTSSGSFSAQAQKTWEAPPTAATTPPTAAPTAAATAPETATTAAPTTAAPTTAAAAPETTTAPPSDTSDTVTAATAPPATPPTVPITQQQVTTTTTVESTAPTAPTTPTTAPATVVTRPPQTPPGLAQTGALAGVLGAIGASLVVLGIAMWTATPRIREHFGRGLR
jgi:hypothetical protein